ncbi:FecR family protein [Caulobacter soli]|uniref:FecR family protein n=1 Tax=Caulobacter soli TaxID=2708539 RepID=UPI0024838D17|nr:FecR domain-containing protein [Caulobacter soli]
MLDCLARLLERQPRTAEDWVVRLGRPKVSPRDLNAFEAWLNVDPRHLEDYSALKATVRESQALRAEFVGDLNLIPRTAKARRRPRAIWLAPVVGGLAAAALVMVVWPAGDPMAGATTYQTAVGEIREIVLTDGSRVTLDTATTLRARLDGPVRRIALDKGTAYFAVAHDKTHPFQVALADRQVIVTGTHFTTGVRDGQAQVTVLEGSVAVSRVHPDQTDALRDATRLKPGDQVSYRAGAPLMREARVDPAQAAAWREHRLIFQDVALTEVVAELSRYTATRIRIADPALGRRRVTAIFPLDGADSVIARADRLLPISVTRTGPGEVTVQAR